MNLSIRDSVENPERKVAQFAHSYRGTFVCSVPDEFLVATKLDRDERTPAEMVEALDEVAAANDPGHGRYWPRPGEECDLHHVASRAALHLRKHSPAHV